MVLLWIHEGIFTQAAHYKKGQDWVLPLPHFNRSTKLPICLKQSHRLALNPECKLGWGRYKDNVDYLGSALSRV